MPIYKGQLVTRVRFSDVNVPPDSQIIQFWSEPAVVVKGPYEKSLRIHHHGRPFLTEVRRYIDVYIKGELLVGLNVDDFERYVLRRS